MWRDKLNLFWDEEGQLLHLFGRATLVSQLILVFLYTLKFDWPTFFFFFWIMCVVGGFLWQRRTCSDRCGHMYHKDCLKNWNMIVNTFPICRRRVAVIRHFTLKIRAYLDRLAAANQLSSGSVNWFCWHISASSCFGKPQESLVKLEN